RRASEMLVGKSPYSLLDRCRRGWDERDAFVPASTATRCVSGTRVDSGASLASTMFCQRCASTKYRSLWTLWSSAPLLGAAGGRAARRANHHCLRAADLIQFLRAKNALV